MEKNVRPGPHPSRAAASSRLLGIESMKLVYKNTPWESWNVNSTTITDQ